MKHPPETITTLSDHFCRVIRQWLTPSQMRLVNERNLKSDPRALVCHTHDFCDANVAMLEAWEKVFGAGTTPALIVDGASEEAIDRDVALINAAWTLAKKRNFNPKS